MPSESRTFETLWAALEMQAASKPNKIAYRILDSSLQERDAISYGDLCNRATTVAAEIARQGCSGQPVALLLPTSLDFIINFFAVMRGGGAVLPLNPKLATKGGEELERIIRECRASAVVGEPSLITRLKQHAPANSLLPPLLRTSFAGEANTVGEQAPPPSALADASAVIQYTSGSTSAPKGACVTHANFLANAQIIASTFSSDENDVTVSWLPLFHDMGLMTGLIWSVVTGASSVLLRPSLFAARPASWLKAISSYRGTMSSAPNFAYQLCVDRISREELAEFDLSSWRVAINGAEPVRPATVRRFIDMFETAGFDGRCFFPSFGLAEATLFVSGGRPNSSPRIIEVDTNSLERENLVAAKKPDSRVRELVACGRPAENLDVRIVDPQTRLSVPERTVGEVWINGPSVSPGYFERPDLNVDVFGGVLAVGSGRHYLRTGDLGFFDNGDLFIVGRIKDLIIVRGQKYAPQDLELTCAGSHPLFEGYRGIIFALDGDEGIVVLHEARNDPAASIADAMDALRAAVAREHGVTVTAIGLLPARTLPLTSSGKVRRAPSRTAWLAGDFRLMGIWNAGAKSSPEPLSAD